MNWLDLKNFSTLLMNSRAYNFYYNTVCHVCKKHSNLKLCSSCRSISYCSSEHQHQDWKSHKRFCKALRNIKIILKCPTNCNYSTWVTYRIHTFRLLEQQLGELLPVEHQMWMFPRVCVVCFSPQVRIDCVKCLNVSYCSEAHKKEHEPIHRRYCKALEISFKMDYHQFAGEPLKEPYKFKFFAKLNSLPCNINELIKQIIDGNFQDDLVRRITICDLLAPAATILFGLEAFKIVNDRSLSDGRLCIHIVGADLTELVTDWETIFQFCFFWIRDLRFIKVILIGPKVEEFALLDRYRRENTIIELRKNFYHEVVDELDDPTIVVGFNAGLSEHIDTEKDLWKASLPALLKIPCVPFLLTSYTDEELYNDLGRFSDINFNIVFRGRNRFSNQRPIRNWKCEQVKPFYVNGCMSIICRSF